MQVISGFGSMGARWKRSLKRGEWKLSFPLSSKFHNLIKSFALYLQRQVFYFTCQWVDNLPGDENYDIDQEKNCNHTKQLTVPDDNLKENYSEKSRLGIFRIEYVAMLQLRLSLNLSSPSIRLSFYLSKLLFCPSLCLPFLLSEICVTCKKKLGEMVFDNQNNWSNYKTYLPKKTPEITNVTVNQNSR